MRLAICGILLSFFLSACEHDAPAHTPEPMDLAQTATLYHNGDVLTMVGDEPSIAEALVEENGQIVFVGTLNEARKQAGNPMIDFDLRGATLMPGFIEPHLHPSLAAVMLQNEIIAPYDWKLPSGVKRISVNESHSLLKIIPDPARCILSGDFTNFGMAHCPETS